jgi:hypothetical protein
MNWIFRAESSGLLFRIQQRHFRFHKRWGIFSRSEKHLFVQEVLCSIEFIDLVSSLQTLPPPWPWRWSPYVTPKSWYTLTAVFRVLTLTVTIRIFANLHLRVAIFVLAWPETSHYVQRSAPLDLPDICICLLNRTRNLQYWVGLSKSGFWLWKEIQFLKSCNINATFFQLNHDSRLSRRESVQFFTSRCMMLADISVWFRDSRWQKRRKENEECEIKIKKTVEEELNQRRGEGRKKGRKEARKEGRKEGRKERRKEGRKERRKEGRKEGRKADRKWEVRNKVKWKETTKKGRNE